MRRNVIFLLKYQFYKDFFRSKVMVIATVLIVFMLLFSVHSRWENYHDRNLTLQLIQNEVQENWEKNPNNTGIQFSLKINNLFDKTYWLGGLNLSRLGPETPRNVLLNTTYKF